jgi:hypothetical protein
MKDRYVLTITVLCILLFLSLFFGYLLFEISNDLKATANGYESDRNICRREYEELVENYEKLEAMYNETN